jgi:hypothetical protein
MPFYRAYRQPSGRSAWRRRVSDNGAGLTSMAILRWSHHSSIGWRYIAAGRRASAGADIMNAIVLRVALVTLLGAAIATPVAAQDYPPAGYSPLLFSRTPPQHVFRLAGVPWVCAADSICKPVHRACRPRPATATIAPLGLPTALPSPSSTRHNKGRPVCWAAWTIAAPDSTPAPAMPLPRHSRSSRTAGYRAWAILRTLDERNGRAQILWCAESGCAELPITRDNDFRLAFLGTAKHDGRDRMWLRERDGNVMACVQPDLDVDDRLECERTPLALADFPRAAALAPIPAAEHACRQH